MVHDRRKDPVRQVGEALADAEDVDRLESGASIGVLEWGLCSRGFQTGRSIGQEACTLYRSCEEW
jgi:hypothetical protein